MLQAFRWVIFLLACGFLYTQLQADKGTQLIEALRAWPWADRTGALVMATFLLVFANWGVEAAKWRILVERTERIGYWRAFIATVAGTSIGFVTPNRTGEFVGRVLFLAPEHRVQAGFATVLGSIAQFVVTMVAGCLGLLALILKGGSLPWDDGWYSSAMASLSALVATGCLVLYLYPRLLRQLLMLLPFLHRWEKPSAVLASMAQRELFVVLALSALRYTVFTGQFILLCIAFGSGISAWSALLAIPVVYLVSTLVPTVLLTELGVRGSAAVAFLVPLGGQEAPVLLATTVLWTFNLVVPAAIGSVLLVTARIRTRSAS